MIDLVNIPMNDDISITAVPPGELIARWDVVEPLIDSALPCTLKRYLAVDVLVMCITNVAQGWLIREDKELIGVMVTKIDNYPRRRGLTVFALAGERMNEWFEKAEGIISDYGRQMGCTFLECQGRPGWQRVLNLEPRAIFLCKDLEAT